MNYLNIFIPDMRKPEVTSCELSELGTWLRLSCYSAGQENGGTIKDCAKWTDRQWMIACGVSAEDVARKCSLWHWRSCNLIVAMYPVEREREVAAKRAAGKATAKLRWPKVKTRVYPPYRARNGSSADSSAISSVDSSAHAEGEVEGEGETE